VAAGYREIRRSRQDRGAQEAGTQGGRRPAQCRHEGARDKEGDATRNSGETGKTPGESGIEQTEKGFVRNLIITRLSVLRAGWYCFARRNTVCLSVCLSVPGKSSELQIVSSPSEQIRISLPP